MIEHEMGVPRDATQVRLDSHDREIAQLRSLMRDGFDQTNRSIKELSAQVGSMGRPDYRVMVAAASFVLALMVAAFTVCGFIYVHDRQSTTDNLSRIESDLHRSLTRQDQMLQREMRDLDAHGMEVNRGLQRQADRLEGLVMLYVKRDIDEAADLRARERRQ